MKKIILIDDEEILLKIYSQALGQEFKVITTSNAKDGLELIKKESPQLVLVDIRMPEMDGLAMLKEMEKQGLLKMPVIILTNVVDDQKVAQAIEFGAKEYILKVKTSPKEVLERVKKYLD